MKFYITAFLLLSLFLANLCAHQCSVSYRFQKRCQHLDPKCIGQKNCTVLRTTLNNVRCPIFRCVRIIRSKLKYDERCVILVKRTVSVAKFL